MFLKPILIRTASAVFLASLLAACQTETPSAFENVEDDDSPIAEDDGKNGDTPPADNGKKNDDTPDGKDNNTPTIDDGKNNGMPPADDSKNNDTPPADDGKNNDTPPADDGKNNDMPPADDSKSDDTPPADDGKSNDMPPADDGKSDGAPPPLSSNDSYSCTHTGNGIDYPVGPGQRYASLADVPWTTLGAGDTVRIFWRSTPYREKILLSTRGSKEQPIRICGVPNADGARPVLSGQDATTSPQFKNLDNYFSKNHSNFQGLGLIIISGNYDEKPANINIEGLHLKQARTEYSFTDTDGNRNSYGNGAACIRVQAGDNIVIKNNEIESCGNGIFTMSQAYNEASLTRNILIESNYLHNNGQPGSYREHGVYIQAIGATYQYNRFGPNAPGADGATLKERVAGSTIRYNWFDSGSSRVMDLVEVEDAGPWYLEKVYRQWASENGEAIDPERLAKVQAADASYRKTFVYGNFIKHVGSKTNAGNLIHYGYDNDPEYAREGTLYFYNNTVSILNDRSDSWRVRLFDVYLYDESASTPAKETVEAFNNIIYHSSETPGAEPSHFCFGRYSGTINLGVNWVSDSWKAAETQSECYPDPKEQPTINGTANLAGTASEAAPIDPNTLEPKSVTSIHNQVQAAADGVPPVTEQYTPHLGSERRSTVSVPGAMELP